MLFLTLCILIIYAIISYILFDKDIMAPPTVVTLGFLFSTLCAFYNERRWGLDFSENTMGIISVGIAAFIIGGLLAIILYNIIYNARFKNKLVFPNRISSVEPIVIETSKTLLIIFAQIVIAIVLFLQLRQITGGMNWANVVSAYRSLTAIGEGSDSIPLLLRQFIQANFAIGLIYIYIIGNNFAAHKKQSKLDWVPVILSCIITFMQGYRSDMLRLWVALLIITYVLKKRTVGWRSSKETKKLAKKMAVSLIAIAVLFVALRGTVGRAETDWDPFYYLTFYAGSPVAALDLFLDNMNMPSDIWGKETFYHLNQNIGSWFNKPEMDYNFFKEFRQSPNGTFIGNVYTALRPPYYDFGLIGLIVFMLVMGLFFTFFYYKVHDKYKTNKIDFRLLVYAYIAYTFFLYFYNLYNTFICFAFIKLVIELLIIRWFLLRVHLRKRYTVKIRKNSFRGESHR